MFYFRGGTSPLPHRMSEFSVSNFKFALRVARGRARAITDQKKGRSNLPSGLMAIKAFVLRRHVAQWPSTQAAHSNGAIAWTSRRRSYGLGAPLSHTSPGLPHTQLVCFYVDAWLPGHGLTSSSTPQKLRSSCSSCRGGG